MLHGLDLSTQILDSLIKRFRLTAQKFDLLRHARQGELVKPLLSNPARFRVVWDVDRLAVLLRPRPLKYSLDPPHSITASRIVADSKV